MKVACYLRVSTGQQDVSNQLPSITAWCEARGYELVEIYQENESAWKAGHQHELARLLSDIRGGKRKYERVIVWSIDRLSRGGIGAIFGLIHTFRQYGCQVVSIQEPWLESAGPAGDILLAVTAWVAEFESKRRSERTKAGLVTAVKNGKHLGRPAGSRDKSKRKRTGYLMRYAGSQIKVRQLSSVGITAKGE